MHLGRLRRQFAHSSLVGRAEYWSARLLQERHRYAEASQALTAAAAQPGYYGMLARLRQAQGAAGGEPPSPLRPVQASTTGPRSQTAVAPEPSRPTAAVEGPGLLRLARGSVALSTTSPDDAFMAEVLTQGSAVLEWRSPQALRVSTLIRLGLLEAAAPWVGVLNGLPGKTSAEVALGRAQVAYALGDYTGAMRQVGAALPTRPNAAWLPREAAAMRLAYPPAHAREVIEAAREFDVSDLLLLSVMRRESAFNPRAASRVSAQGLMQIMPSTGRRIAAALHVDGYDDSQLTRPAINIRFAAWYLRALIDKFHGNLAVAIGSYNAGPAASDRWLRGRGGAATDVYVEDVPFHETRDYIKNVLANLATYQRIYDGGSIELPEAVDATVGDQVNF